MKACGFGRIHRQASVFGQECHVRAGRKVVDQSASHAFTANPTLSTRLLDHRQGGV